MGKVYLVGAGPGDAGLITVKGLEKLRQCDAVVYDRLAAEELLDVVPPGCDKIYVGKEAGKHYKKQEEINEILLECAKTHAVTVRLKGGDPFVFGRGGEEIEALRAQDIPYEVIPGITSSVAVPACAGIPVTHRGVSRSFHVITGHTNHSEGSPEYDYETLAKTEGTLIFLMGLANLSDIAGRLIQAGKPEDTPVAVISEGTTLYQKVVRGTLQDIGQQVIAQGIKSPAIIVIGETAAYDYRYHPVGDRRVGITATDLLMEKLEAGFLELGMQPIPLCNMQVVKTEGLKELTGELPHLDNYQWVLFTSQNGVTLFFEELRKQKTDIRTLAGLRFAALGSGTAARLLDYGIHADFIPSEYTVSVLAKELAEQMNPEARVLIPRAAQGSRELNEIFDRKGIAYKDIPIYDVVGKMTKNWKCLDTLDYLVFVSASGVSAFFRELKERKLSVPPNVKLVCIGKVTQERLQKEYKEADIVATVNDVAGLLEAVKKEEAL